MATPTYVTAGSTDITYPDNSTVDATIDTTATGSDRILIVQVAYRYSSNVDVTGITYNGVAMTSFGAAVIGGPDSLNQIWYLVAPATGSNTLTITTDDNNGSQAGAVSWMVFQDVDQVTPYDGYTSNTGTDGTGELTVTSEVGDTPFFTITYRGSGTSAAAATNYTERYDNVFNGTNFLATGGEGTGAASVDFVATMTTVSPVGWAALGANLNASSGGGFTPIQGNSTQFLMLMGLGT